MNKKNQHKKLSEEFIKGQFIFKQTDRKGDLAVYKKVNRHTKHFTYEVIKISRHDGYEVAGVKIEPAEVYPSSSVWGTYGWTFITYEKALEKFFKLQN